MKFLFALTFLTLIHGGSSLTATPSSNMPPRVALAATGSPEHYYNDALEEEANGDLADASLALRRAVALHPTFMLAQKKLSEVLAKMGLVQETTWQTELAQKCSPEILIYAGSLLGWSAAFVVIWLFFTRSLAVSTKRKCRWALFLAICFCFLGHAVAMVGTMIDPRRTARDAVILLPKNDPTAENSQGKPQTTPLRATPVDNATTIAELPTGCSLILLSRHGVWSYVRMSSGQEGWIASSTLVPLIP